MRLLRSALSLCAALLAASAVPAAGAEPSRLLLQQERLDGNLRLLATVTETSGRGVEGAEVVFQARTAFGWLKLGGAETDARGKASVDLPAASPYAEVSAQAGEATVVRAEVVLRQNVRGGPATRPGRDVLERLSPQPGFISPYPPVQIVLVAVILGGIWATYAYLVSLLIRIRRTS